MSLKRELVDEQIDVNGIKVSLKLLEEEQNIEELEPRTRFLSAGFAFIAFGVILWSVLGTQAVDKIVKAYNFQEGLCQANQSVVLVRNQSCQCEGRSVCQSKFPCVKVNIVVKDLRSNLNESVLQTVIYDSIYDLNAECSIGPPCKRNYQDNLQAVESFTSKFRNHSDQVACYFNPADQQQVILNRDSHVSDLFHAIFWPFLFVVIGFIMFCKFFRSK
ncbi:uncharacterized protein LOC116287901 [Actinia tenebrosa]|uniref:Uncharacterized protein LOC116287901 n=1 Tax=Actinia tenebrosa TaxID=6105 RepID=A0A6P8H4V8_ACTTE|nr:uncharacterized protein LOC116287901 [Actinia tenebrosa]